MISKIKNLIRAIDFALRASNEKMVIITQIQLKYDVSISQYQSMWKMSIIELIEILDKGFEDDFRNY